MPPVLRGLLCSMSYHRAPSPQGPWAPSPAVGSSSSSSGWAIGLSISALVISIGAAILAVLAFLGLGAPGALTGEWDTALEGTAGSLGDVGEGDCFNTVTVQPDTVSRADCEAAHDGEVYLLSERARQEGPLPWPVGYLVGAALALAIALISVGLLLGSRSGYQERLERAILANAQVIAVDARDPYLATVQYRDPATGQVSRHDIVTVFERTVGEQVQIRLDPEDPTWVEMVSEPWDPTYWLTISLLALVVGSLLTQELVRRRRGLPMLLQGVHPAVRVCAAPGPDGDGLDLACLDDPRRQVWATLPAPMALDRVEPLDDVGAEEEPSPGEEVELRWRRPTHATLFGDLRPQGVYGLLIDSHLFMGPAMATVDGRPRDLPDPDPTSTLPSDLEDHPPTEDELRLMRAELLDGASPVAPAYSLPPLPLAVYSHTPRRALGLAVAGAALIAVPVLTWGDTPDAWVMLPALVASGLALTNGISMFLPQLVLQEDGVRHAAGLRSWTIPYTFVRTVAVRGRCIVLELTPGAAPDHVDTAPDDDVLVFDSPPLASTAQAEQTARIIEALRQRHGAYPKPGAQPSNGPVNTVMIGALALHVVLGLVLLGMALSH